jgi:hypothetical protein
MPDVKESNMLREQKSSPFLVFFLVAAGVTLALVVAPRLFAGQHPNAAIIAEGGGTTIIQGGTARPGLSPLSPN